MGRIIPYIMETKGPDNPTSQLLPIMSNSNKCCRGEGEGRKDKGCGGGSRSKTSCMWRVVRDKVRWCATKKMVYVTKFCVKDRVCVWKLCVKDGVWQSGVWKMVCGKRTMCRVPRCHVEKSKHVIDSCDCTRQKVHCWIRKFRGTPISGNLQSGGHKKLRKAAV